MEELIKEEIKNGTNVINTGNFDEIRNREIGEQYTECYIVKVEGEYYKVSVIDEIIDKQEWELFYEESVEYEKIEKEEAEEELEAIGLELEF